MAEEKIIEDVESAVCDHVGVTKSQMMEKTKKGACVKARHLSILILHNMFKLSIRTLCLRYGYTQRQVFRINSQMKAYIEYNCSYRDLYNSIVDSIEHML